MLKNTKKGFMQDCCVIHAGFLRNPSPFGVTSYKPKIKNALESGLSDAFLYLSM